MAAYGIGNGYTTEEEWTTFRDADSEEAATEAGTEAAGEVTTKKTEEVAVTEDNIEEIVEIEEEVENVSNNEIVARVELKIASPEDNGMC